jgi:hypothetical protein
MTRHRPTDRVYLAGGLLWLAIATAAAAWDWPTPARLAEQRYRLALLTANALDKTFLPSSAVIGDDLEGPYRALTADFTARFGPRFNVAAIEARHNAAMAGLAAERLRIVCFTLAATAAIGWLLTTIRAALAITPGRP